MEVNEKNINEVVKVLTKKGLEDASIKVKNLSEIAKELMEKYPDLTPEQLGQKYDEELQLEEQNNQMEQLEGQDRDED